MARLVVVDAYNAVYRLLGDPPADRDVARRFLVDRTQAAIRRGGLGGLEGIHLVFDTWPGAARRGLRSREGLVTWRYARGSADDEILDRLRRTRGRGKGADVVVVTDDRELGGRARQLGATVMGVEAFYGPAPDAPDATRWHSPEDPPLSAHDFDLPEGEIDLDDPYLPGPT